MVRRRNHGEDMSRRNAWMGTICALGLMLGAALHAGTAAGADAPAGKGTPKEIDVATFTCEAAVSLNKTDAKRYGELAQWLTGWQAEVKADTDLSFSTIKKSGADWLAACGSQPAAVFSTVTAMPEKSVDPISMAAMKCEEFLILLDSDKNQAMGVIRWLDGWNARAVNETTANFYYHKKQLDSAVNGCMKYPKRPIMYVVGGRYR